MSSFIFTLTLQAVVLADDLIVSTYYNLLVRAMLCDTVTFEEMDLTGYQVEDLNSLTLENPVTSELIFTKVSMTTEYFFQLISKFSSISRLELNDVSVQYPDLSRNYNPFNSLGLLTFQATDLPANERFFSQLLKIFPNLDGLVLDNNINPQIIAMLTENLQTHTGKATITKLFLKNSKFKWETFLPFLEQFPNLRWLSLSNNEIGAGFKIFPPMKNLRTISMEKTSLTPQGLFRVIESCPKLENLWVTGDELTELTDGHLQALQWYRREKGEEALTIDVHEPKKKSVDALKKFCDIKTAYLIFNC